MIVIYSIIFLLILQDALLIFFLRYHFLVYPIVDRKKWPKITVLIPARNESENLPECLRSLEKMDYPKDQLQIILGNDQSTDGTLTIMKDWQMKDVEVKIIDIQENPSPQKMNGKAHALSKMIEEATGDYLLFTDADCEVGELWVKSMVSAVVQSKASYVTGVTWVKSEGLFQRLQNLDWVLTLGMVKVMTDRGKSITSMGNNMLIHKNDYLTVGGFEAAPFSLTEDFEIAKCLNQHGFEGIHHVSKENLVFTKGKSTIKSLLSQRQRWMSGAMGLSFPWKLLLGLQVLFFPAILLFLMSNGWIAGWIWFVKILLQSYFIRQVLSKTEQYIPWKTLFLFEIYYIYTSWMTLLYYFFRSTVEWKGRKY
jgi:cellulose synthase/poly-beta-1,6-N-acetylglucosamine synthase-like glycosyltransferase